MKSERFFELMHLIDDDLIIKIDKINPKDKKKRNLHIKYGAIAACFLVIFGIFMILPIFRDRPSYDPTYSPNIFDATLSPNKLSGSSLEFVVGNSAGSGSSSANEPPRFDFNIDSIVVKAKVVDALPDLYYKLNVSSEYKQRPYRLIKMETMETINGEEMPQYFYYLIPEYLFVDMSVYDSLLISISQVGAENYVLRNGTENQMEAFSLPVFDDYQDHPELGNIIAFTDGIFDESLWQTTSWLYGYQFGRYYLEYPGSNYLVVSRGSSESEAISEIKNRISELKEWRGDAYCAPSVISLDFTDNEAKDALDFVKHFENGVFSQVFLENNVIFRRYINGCQTEETISIDLLTENVTYSDVRYTKEDMANMENIATQISNKAKEYSEQFPLPPHTDPNGKALNSLSLYGWYVKSGDKVYGVVKTVWWYMEQKELDVIMYYDDTYTLYDASAETAIIISRDELVDIVGTRNVYLGEYKGIIAPMC